EPDVVGFEIAMDDALLMRFVYGRADLFEYVHRPFERQAFLFREYVAEREAEVGHVHDVGVAQTTGGAGLALEAFDELLVAHELRRDQFQRNETLRAE